MSNQIKITPPEESDENKVPISQLRNRFEKMSNTTPTDLSNSKSQQKQQTLNPPSGKSIPVTQDQKNSSVSATQKTTVQCTDWIISVLEQIQNFFNTSPVAKDIFVHLNQVKDEKENRSDVIKINMKSLACWGLVDLKQVTNKYALNQYAKFLNALELAFMHLDKSLDMAEKNPQDPERTTQTK